MSKASLFFIFLVQMFIFFSLRIFRDKHRSQEKNSFAFHADGNADITIEHYGNSEIRWCRQRLCFTGCWTTWILVFLFQKNAEHSQNPFLRSSPAPCVKESVETLFTQLSSSLRIWWFRGNVLGWKCGCLAPASNSTINLLCDFGQTIPSAVNPFAT